mmetsp:Transcript_46643/g.146231  ORF Transcript_46643/g.146231 Transcript_46643/m.146231 type:complete len:232 (-) Transcript_46643:1511-2206(-)
MLKISPPNLRDVLAISFSLAVCLLLYVGAHRNVGQHALLQSASRIGYAGIVPYVREKPRRVQAVTCGGGSSVGCVVQSLSKSIRNTFSAPEKKSRGRIAVEKAARGLGFSPWQVGKQTTRQRAHIQKKLESTSNSGFGFLRNIVNGYENLDHEIDYGGKELPERGSKRFKAHQAISETIEKLKREKLKLLHELNRQKAKKVVKQVSKGSYNWMDGWLDGKDRKVPNEAWSY